MRKTPSQIARSLRALKNAQRLGLLRGVRILPGRNACEAAVAQFGVDYSGNAVPHLPLAECTQISVNASTFLSAVTNFVGYMQLQSRRPSRPIHDQRAANVLATARVFD